MESVESNAKAAELANVALLPGAGAAAPPTDAEPASICAPKAEINVEGRRCDPLVGLLL